MRVLRAFLLPFFLFLSPFFSAAQNELDALRYSRSGLHGTARYVGMGGAFGALGADLSGVSSNPAGIGLLRKSKFSFTPSINKNISRSSFGDQSVRSDQLELAVEQVGGALSISSDGPKESIHLGVSYQRRRSFNEDIRIENQNPGASLLDRFVRISNGIPLSQLNDKAPFTGELAYQTYLMDPIGDSSSYSHRLEGADHGMNKRIERSGNMGETNITLGVDRDHHYYYGVSVGIPTIRFQRKIVHKENVRNGSDVRDFRYEEELNVKGSGLNLQFGGIYRPGPKWRFGLSARTPSILYLKENWSTRLKADHGPGDKREEGPIEGKHAYRILTPYRLYGSAAYFIQKKGLITLEYRFSDHRASRLLPSRDNSGGYGYAEENAIIQDRFQAGHDLRIGGEWRISPFYLRGGYRMNSQLRRPIDGKEEGLTHQYSVGTGYREGGFFLDLAYRWSVRSELHRPIGPQEGGTSRIAHRMQGILITGGTRF